MSAILPPRSHKSGQQHHAQDHRPGVRDAAQCRVQLNTDRAHSSRHPPTHRPTPRATANPSSIHQHPAVPTCFTVADTSGKPNAAACCVGKGVEKKVAAVTSVDPPSRDPTQPITHQPTNQPTTNNQQPTSLVKTVAAPANDAELLMSSAPPPLWCTAASALASCPSCASTAAGLLPPAMSVVDFATADLGRVFSNPLTLSHHQVRGQLEPCVQCAVEHRAQSRQPQPRRNPQPNPPSALRSPPFRPSSLVSAPLAFFQVLSPLPTMAHSLLVRVSAAARPAMNTALRTSAAAATTLPARSETPLPARELPFGIVPSPSSNLQPLLPPPPHPLAGASKTPGGRMCSTARPTPFLA